MNVLLQNTRELQRAIRSKNFDFALHLLDALSGFDLAHDPKTGLMPLHEATEDPGAAILIPGLLACGFKPENEDQNELTVLQRAVRNDNAPVLAALLDAGVDPNATNRAGQSPLLVCALYGRPKLAELLLARGADVNRQASATGNTPLHEVARYGSSSVVAVLLAHGASLDIRNLDGRLPEDMVGDENIASMLQAARAERAMACSVASAPVAGRSMGL